MEIFLTLLILNYIFSRFEIPEDGISALILYHSGLWEGTWKSEEEVKERQGGVARRRIISQDDRL